jgi:BirA family biotin operon repressor/biotin-[acetyl-CoA-carboxylase] ligase
LEIYSFERLPSTQRHLIDALRRGDIATPAAVFAREQYDGIGSRENRWEGARGNFFASFALSLEMLPEDLPLASASIYVSWLMKRTLADAGCACVWVKWPNDFYVEDKKAGGTVTHIVEKSLVWGIGINLKKAPKNFAVLQCRIDAEILFNMYVKRLENLPSWKQVFSEYEIEFERSRTYDVHTRLGRKSLKEARLCRDGSLLIEGRKVYSQR